MASADSNLDDGGPSTVQPMPPKKAGGYLPALAWMSLALVSFTMVAVAGRQAGLTMSALDMLFYRSLISFLIIASVVKLLKGSLRSMATTQPRLHVVRGCLHLSAQWAWFQALLLIPLTNLFALEFTAPLWVAVLSPLLLGEKLTGYRIVAALLGFAGAMVIIRPGQATLDAGSILALSSALGFALTMISTKRLTRRDTPLQILFWMATIQLVLTLLIHGPFVKLPPDALTAFWLLLIGALGLTAHVGLTQAFAHADAIIVAPLDFLRLPLIAFVGIVFYNEPLLAIVLIGTGFVVVGNALNMWGESRRSR